MAVEGMAVEWRLFRSAMYRSGKSSVELQSFRIAFNMGLTVG
jgi:hypothetical protein